jgi:Tfp pilus assembly protein PilE
MLLWVIGGVGCLGLVVCSGVLGVFVGVPAFMKYMERSKSAESAKIMAKIAESAKSHYADNDVFPGKGMTLKTTSSPPEGGVKCEVQSADSSSRTKARKALNWPSSGETLYFQYTYSARGQGSEASATIRAKADFDPSNEDVHTTVQTLEVEEGRVELSNPFTQNEFK